MSLKPLFISKVRIELLEVFLTNPGEIYYVRQLVRIIHEEINAVRRELAHMEKADMVYKEHRGNRLYYGFNNRYAYYEDLVSMISKTTGLGVKLLQNRNKLGTLKLIMFSTKFVLNVDRRPDEIDILIVGEVVMPELEALVKGEEAQREREINYTVMDRDEYVYRKDKRDPFLIDIIHAPRIMILGTQLDLVGK